MHYSIALHCYGAICMVMPWMTTRYLCDLAGTERLPCDNCMRAVPISTDPATSLRLFWQHIHIKNVYLLPPNDA